MNKFLKIIDWLYFSNVQFGVDHVAKAGKIYWLDSKKDRKELYKIYKAESNKP